MDSGISPSEVHKKYIDQRIARKEDRRLEFKAAVNGFDSKKTARYCVAIANSGGGEMFFGITDQIPRSVVGTSAFGDPQETERRLVETLGLKITVKVFDYEGKRVVGLAVPSRPHGTPLQLDGAYWTRTGESLVGMTPDELKAIFDETRLPYEEEEAYPPMSADDVLALLDSSVVFRLLGTHSPHTPEGQLEEFQRLGLVKESSLPGEWIVLKLGALIAARDLMDFGLQSHKLRIITYGGTGRLDAISDRFYDSGYADSLPRTVELLTSILPNHEDFSQAKREEVPTYPVIALRELIANAVVHQDFHRSAGGNYPTVEVFKDRVEISNGGTPLIDVKKFVTQNAQRNRIMSDVMRRIGLAENRGSGVDRSLAAFEEIQGAAPEFITESYMTRVILRGSQSWEQMGPDGRQWAAYMHCCLKWASGEHMTNSSLRARFGLASGKTQVISNLIAELVRLNVIIIDPSGPSGNKGRRYIPHP